MGTVLGVRGVLGVLVVLMIAGCSDLRVKLGVFNTAAEALSGGAIAAGWVPEGVPARATDLRAGYLPDGRHWGVFSYDPSDEPIVRALTRDEITSGPLACDPPGRLEFWPRVIRTPVDVDRVRSTGFRLYRGTDARTYAINWGQRRAYYWK